MNSYLDSSCFIRRITRDGPGVLDWDAWEYTSASILARVEVARAFNPLLLEGVYTEVQYQEALVQFSELAEGVEWLPLSDVILRLAAQRTAQHLKALDAIHLATARIVRDTFSPDLVFATHDRRLGAAAVAMSFDVAGV